MQDVEIEPIDFEPELHPDFNPHPQHCQCPDCQDIRSSRNGAYFNGVEWETLV